jgi:hypothetical protein
MKVLVATIEQKQALEGIYKNAAVLQFIEDLNNNWVVNIPVISDDNFIEIRTQLEALPQIEYQPKQTEIL